MRHQNHKNRLSVNSDHRKSIIRNLAIEVIEHGKVKTTLARARAVKPYVEKLITKAKVDTVTSRRLVFSRLNNKAAVALLFKDVAPKFVTRPGGYTRIVKLADTRVGDAAPMGIISLVE